MDGRAAAAALTTAVQQLPDVFCHGLLEQLRATLDTFTLKVVTPTSAEREAKRELFNSFTEFLRKAMQDRIAIAVAGSTAYEVDARNSDLDVVLLTSWGAPNYVLQSVVHYLSMTQALHNRAANWPLKNVQLQLVDSARVPVLVVTTPSGLVCDVSVNTVNSIKHTEYFKRVLASTPTLRPLLRLVKYWTKARKLPAAKEGGLPGIVWMILACTYGSCPAPIFLKAVHRPTNDGLSRTLSHIDGTVPIFARLYRFFHLCSNRDLMSRTITSSDKLCFPKSKKHVAQRVASAANFC
ncbi:poly(A) polymerase central domain protein, partial [Gregarina niphandrodes]